MRPVISTILLLTGSNVFMTFAWYAHLKNLAARPWYVAALVSWGIAFFEYLLQVPGNRIGYTELSLPQLKILQEVITLAVFVPFALLYMHKSLKLDYLWAALCILGAVYFVFRGRLASCRGRRRFHIINTKPSLSYTWKRHSREAFGVPKITSCCRRVAKSLKTSESLTTASYFRRSESDSAPSAASVINTLSGDVNF